MTVYKYTIRETIGFMRVSDVLHNPGISAYKYYCIQSVKIVFLSTRLHSATIFRVCILYDIVFITTSKEYFTTICIGSIYYCNVVFITTSAPGFPLLPVSITLWCGFHYYIIPYINPYLYIAPESISYDYIYYIIWFLILCLIVFGTICIVRWLYTLYMVSILSI